MNSYYNVGKLLLDAGNQYGESIIKEYSLRLTEDLGPGYSQRNLRNMRQFYKVFQKWQTVSAKLSWGHYCEILWFDDNKFQYYVKIAELNNLSIRQLREKIKSNEYERLPEFTKNKLLNQDAKNAVDFVKNPIKIKNDNKYDIYADELIGNEINLDMPSVGATINAIFASVKAKGQTIINNSAQEPEIDNVIDFLNNMGADIKRDKTSIIINGVEHLHSSEINVIPDRIEAGTYLILGALIGNNLKEENVIPEHKSSLLDKFDEMGVNYKIDKNSIIVSKTDNLKPVEVITKGYPGFATDLQQPFTVLLTQCDGVSHLTETIYENRFQNVEYLNSMGANIKINERTIEITGKTKLTANTVKATDLRAGACMVLASLIADGKTIIEDINHVLRGYENIIQKLQNIGAKIEE